MEDVSVGMCGLSSSIQDQERKQKTRQSLDCYQNNILYFSGKQYHLDSVGQKEYMTRKEKKKHEKKVYLYHIACAFALGSPIVSP
jgi:hypothetical protein